MATDDETIEHLFQHLLERLADIHTSLNSINDRMWRQSTGCT
jgi:hypothetical protein